jgi:DNA-binding IclR family transcriptional regulator/sugar lactone lactonase YvrE
MVEDGGKAGGGVQGTGLITKACDILDLVGNATSRIGIQELVKETGLAKSTIHRIVSALTARGLLRSEGRGQTLSLGFHFLDLAQNVWAFPDLVTTAAGELRHLRDMTGETAYLAAISDNGVVVLAKYVGAHANSSMTALGVSNPLYCTSQGKAILAFLPEKQADRLISTVRFEALTPFTITSSNLLKHRLEIIRQRGFSVDDQEIVLGSRCVGAPVFDAEGHCIAAISVAGPAYRVTLERIEQLGPELIEAARRISDNLRPRPSIVEQRGAKGWAAHGETSFHGIAPLWSERENCLYWADRLAPAVYVMPMGEQPLLLAKLPYPIDAMTLAPDGGVDVFCREGWYRIKAGSEGPCLMRTPCPRISAIRTGPDGVVWAAVTENGRTEIGPLNAALNVEMTWSLAGEINDLVTSPGGDCLYAADGQRGIIHELRRGHATPRILARITRGSGQPRGLGVDADGRLWVALWDGWSIAQLDESGEIGRILALPVPRPTGLAFGGADMTSLHVTTARLGLPRDILDNAPLSGRLLVLDSGLNGPGDRISEDLAAAIAS